MLAYAKKWNTLRQKKREKRLHFIIKNTLFLDEDGRGGDWGVGGMKEDKLGGEACGGGMGFGRDIK